MGLHDLVPPGTSVATGRLDDPRWLRSVPPADEALATGCTAVRRRELLAGRACARLALQHLGRPLGHGATVGTGGDRGPLWPPGVVGSITHGAGEVAAVVTGADALRGLGVDVEVATALPDAVVTLVADDAELRAAAGCDLGPLGPSVVFAAKEAVYKAWAPRRGWLEHHEVRVLLRPDGSATAAVATDAGRTGDLRVRWEVEGEVVRCVAWWLSSPDGPPL